MNLTFSEMKNLDMKVFDSDLQVCEIPPGICEIRN